MFDNYFYQDLNEDEQVLQVIRKHWISIIVPFIKTFVTWIILVILAPFILKYTIGVLGFFFILAVSLGYITYRWITWYFDTFIITSHRIIDIDQNSIFRRRVAEVRLEEIQDVTYETTGFISTSLDYGTVRAQTASTVPNIEMTYVTHPKEVQDLISSLQHDIKQKEKAANQQEIINLVKQQFNQTENKENNNDSPEE